MKFAYHVQKIPHKIAKKCETVKNSNKDKYFRDTCIAPSKQFIVCKKMENVLPTATFVIVLDLDLVLCIVAVVNMVQ